MKISLNIDEYYPGTYLKILIVFDDIIKDKIINLKLEPIVTELFTRGREINVALAFITQSYLVVPKQNQINLNRVVYNDDYKLTLISTNFI